MIKKITKAYVRTYTDSWQVTAYVEWEDTNGKKGTTEGNPNNLHMRTLLERAEQEGVKIETETW